MATVAKAVTRGQFSVRAGLATGPVVAGVIGVSKPAFDLWGITVHFLLPISLLKIINIISHSI